MRGEELEQGRGGDAAPEAAMYQELKIVASEGKRRRRQPPKTREFIAYLVGLVEADSMWEKGGQGHRPVWIAYASTPGMARPFTTNLRGGNRVEWGNGPAAHECLEIPKSSSHRWMTQETGDGAVITTAYLPELFHLEPIVPPERVTFISMPPRWWVDREASKLEPTFGPDAREAVQAGLFAAYLDRRTALPIPSELGFQLRLYRAALGSSLRVRDAENRYNRQGVVHQGTDLCGVEAPVAIDASHHDVAALLTAEVRKFFEEVVRDGKTRKPEGRRVLPDARKAPVQLSLDFSVACVA